MGTGGKLTLSWDDACVSIDTGHERMGCTRPSDVSQAAPEMAQLPAWMTRTSME